ncbi:MAG: hypothetical protein DI585_05710 [Pseudomonas fluorescens]|nr:MAG: hypothetical protein DI585_05710 [Pseudomonas fluorescens]
METHRTALLVLAGAMFAALPFTVSAQERSASGSVDLQMTWTALNSLVQSSVAKSDMVNARVDQVVVCNRKAMLYAPGGGADADGCIENSKITALNQRVDTINTQISNINDQITTLNGRVGTAEARLNTIDGTLSTQAGQIRDLFDRSDDLRKKATELYNRTNELYSNVNTLSNQINGINGTLTNHGNRLNVLDSQVNSINSRINTINGQISTINAQIGDLYNRTNDLYNRTNDLYNNVNYMKHCGDNRMVLSNGGCVRPAANCVFRTGGWRNGAVLISSYQVQSGSQGDNVSQVNVYAWVECN